MRRGDLIVSEEGCPEDGDQDGEGLKSNTQEELPRLFGLFILEKAEERPHGSLQMPYREQQRKMLISLWWSVTKHKEME